MYTYFSLHIFKDTNDIEPNADFELLKSAYAFNERIKNLEVCLEVKCAIIRFNEAK